MRSTNIVRLLSCLLPAAVLALSACSEDPTSSGTGTPAHVELSRATTFQEVGRQATLSAWVRDVNGNRLAEAVTATSSTAGVKIDSTIFHPETSETRIFYTPTAIDTTGYILVTAGSLTDTAYVRALPSSLKITLADSIGSGVTVTPVIAGVSATGATIGNVKYTVTSSDTTKVYVNSNGTLTARGTGRATLTFTGPGGKITATKDVTVVAGPFAGTVVASAGPNGSTLLTFTAPTGVTFDADTKVVMNTGDAPIVASSSATVITVVLPFNLAGGSYTYSLTDVGPSQLALGGTVTLAATATNETGEPNDTPATGTPVTAGTDAYGSVSTTDADDFWTLTVTTAAKYKVEVFWSDAADIDLYVLNSVGKLAACSDDFLGCAAASSKNPESGTTTTLAPGTYRIYVNLYDASGPSSTYRLRVTQQ